jgi:hypothetical protein
MDSGSSKTSTVAVWDDGASSQDIMPANSIEARRLRPVVRTDFRPVGWVDPGGPTPIKQTRHPVTREHVGFVTRQPRPARKCAGARFGGTAGGGGLSPIAKRRLGLMCSGPRPDHGGRCCRLPNGRGDVSPSLPRQIQ